MNIVRELRKRKGVQQKELAAFIGVSQPTVSDWEAGKTDPSGERLKKLAEYFDVDELVILGKGSIAGSQPLFVPIDPKISGVSQTEQIVQHVLERLNDSQPKTEEARILSAGIDKLPKAQREMALNVVKAMFAEYADYFKKGTDESDT